MWSFHGNVELEDKRKGVYILGPYIGVEGNKRFRYGLLSTWKNVKN